MATVTVVGANGEFNVPFNSEANAALAQQLASQIVAAIDDGTLVAPDPDNPPPGLPTAPGGAYFGLQDIESADDPNIQNPLGYPAIVVNTDGPVTLTGAPIQLAPYSIIGGVGGLTFFGGNSSLGGSIFLGGGQNVIGGSSDENSAPDSTNGGLVGNWTIGTGSPDPSDTDLIRLASGNDSLFVGANDTIATGGANALIQGAPDASSPNLVFLGTGNVSFFGGSESGDLVTGLGTATGNDFIVGGLGGNNTIVAGTGNATLVAGGDGDLLFGSQAATQQQLWASGNDTLIAGGASSDTFFGFTGISSTGNVMMSAASSTGDNAFWAGAGNDTIWTGLGNDSVFVFADRTQNESAPSDLIFGWNAKDTLYLAGYSGGNFSSSTLGVTLNLSDGTQVTFAGVTDPNNIKIG